MKALQSIGLLIISNVFMTLAWYGNIGFKNLPLYKNGGLITIIFISWAIALAEYIFMVPANRLGSEIYGGPFNLIQLKTIQEAVSLVVFSLVSVYVFKDVKLGWNHLAGFALILGAVFVIFKKW